MRLVADVFGKWFCWSASTEKPWDVKDTLTALSLLCSCALFAWIAVALIRHFDDPKWPITSVNMFSMLCGNMDCDESFRASTYNVPRWCAVALSLAGTSIVLARMGILPGSSVPGPIEGSNGSWPDPGFRMGSKMGILAMGPLAKVGILAGSVINKITKEVSQAGPPEYRVESVHILAKDCGDGSTEPTKDKQPHDLLARLQGRARYGEAEELSRECLRIRPGLNFPQHRRAKLGEEHPNTLVSVSNLAALLKTRGELKPSLSTERPLPKTVPGICYDCQRAKPLPKTVPARSRYRKQSLEFVMTASGRSRYRKQSLEFAMTASGRSRYRKQSLEFAMTASGRSNYRKKSLEFAMTASGRSRYRKQSLEFAMIARGRSRYRKQPLEFAMTASGRSRYRKKSLEFAMTASGRSNYRKKSLEFAITASGRSRYRKQSLEFAMTASGRSRYRKQSLEFAMTASGRSRYDCERAKPLPKTVPGICYDCERAKPSPKTVPWNLPCRANLGREHPNTLGFINNSKPAANWQQLSLFTEKFSKHARELSFCRGNFTHQRAP
ncbi:Cyt-b5 [Symbiodinium natans]|uniref:Cyt-b5 protein n=1 Tax=Symbiodinium natans TaxID=878477 RepID=A0A812GH14_9DINO|nr:Cyt-b5 [Symbiodinium natans]